MKREIETLRQVLAFGSARGRLSVRKPPKRVRVPNVIQFPGRRAGGE